MKAYEWKRNCKLVEWHFIEMYSCLLFIVFDLSARPNALWQREWIISNLWQLSLEWWLTAIILTKLMSDVEIGKRLQMVQIVDSLSALFFFCFCFLIIGNYLFSSNMMIMCCSINCCLVGRAGKTVCVFIWLFFPVFKYLRNYCTVGFLSYVSFCCFLFIANKRLKKWIDDLILLVISAVINILMVYTNICRSSHLQILFT